MANPVAPIAEAIAEGFKLLKTLQDTKEVRRYKAAIDAAETYIAVNEGDRPYNEITEKARDKLLLHYKKRFLTYNQG